MADLGNVACQLETAITLIRHGRIIRDSAKSGRTSGVFDGQWRKHPPTLVNCPECGKLKYMYARSLCKTCYGRQYNAGKLSKTPSHQRGGRR